MQTTLPANELLVEEIRAAIPSEDVATLTEHSALTFDIGENLVQQLTLALDRAPDDASRSRVEGVLVHMQAALESLRMVQSDTTLDSARGRLEQARGEAQEALDELRPFIFALVARGAISGK